MSFVSSLYHSYRSLTEKLYSNWISKQLGSVGTNSIISRHCRILGGGEKNIHIGDNSIVSENCILESWQQYGSEHFSPEIIIGNNCKIGEYNHITACNKIELGDGLLTGRFVLITDNNHGSLNEVEANIRPIDRPLNSKGAIIVGKNVWLGDKVTICSGVHIGDNVIVAANSVVTKDIPSNCMAAGIPAIIKKTL